LREEYIAQIPFKKLNERATTPTRGSNEAAGFDLYSCIDYDITINAGETAMIPTGIAVAIPRGMFGAVFARSGIAVKRGLRPANAVGVIDSDYRGELMIALHNDSGTAQVIEPNMRIAQLVIIPYLSGEFVEYDELDSTDRGSGGFGSTGEK
jgi:dUTP pyrophosphatase